MTLSLSRRSTLETLGALGAGSATPGTALAVDEHEDNDRDDESPAGDGLEVAAVRLAHFSTDAPALNVSLDDEQVLSDVAAGEVSSYLEVEPGTHSVRMTAADDSQTVVFEDTVSFSPAFYTLAAIGDLETETFRPLILTDAGSALVRLGHAAADAPAVSVTETDGQLSLSENASFGAVTGYVALPAGQYSFEVIEAGDGDGSADHEDGTSDSAPLTTFDVDLKHGGAYTAYATGAPEADDGPGALSVTVTEDGATGETANRSDESLRER